MEWLKEKTVVLGITGGISAYRACDIVRLMIQDGATVHVVMTKAALEFITPLTLQTLSQNMVVTDLFDLITESRIGHISLAQGADLLLVSPATANIIGKFANGIADDMLSTLYLATEAPTVMAPAMNEKMYENIVVQDNIRKLRDRGVFIVDPAWGELACGDTGWGRLAPVEKIVEAVRSVLSPRVMEGKKVLVTAGPTAEPVDPVRELTNRSSGKMGFALAKVANRLGAEVVLISGPVALEDPWFVKTVRVRTGEEMYRAVMDNIDGAEIVVKAAAVADFRPSPAAGKKVKKDAFPGTLKLDRSRDILATIGKMNPKPYLIGFAAETENLRENALKKMEEKNIDAIVTNDVSRDDIGFSSDYNEANLYFRDGTEVLIPKDEKDAVAFLILERVSKRFAL
jgi:phosphopantothenoylcysteine decarboxylase/phosphopantothenate--cysteine ligase